MSKIDQYLKAATRDNTRQSYQSAIRHFEIVWGGFLPATADNIANYLADCAETLSINTLRQRLAALSQWHRTQGFPDPTRSPIVRKVFKGIQALHPVREKQAKPIQLEELEQVVGWLQSAIKDARAASNRTAEIRYTRNKALLLIGFWRGFRSDELINLLVENVTAKPGGGMICFLPHTKGDRNNKGVHFKTPSLLRLCPVEAYIDWISLSQLTSGPVFRSIDRWGHLAEKALHADSLTPILRSILGEAGIASTAEYSGHSMRRGFANWATSNGWGLKNLMEYVGWKDINSAIRYIDGVDPLITNRINSSLVHEFKP